MTAPSQPNPALNSRKDTANLRGNMPERCPPSGISVLIVGAGVAGFMAALECWRNGHEVQIIEKSPTRLTAGDGFSIGPTAIRAFRNWPDMLEENERIAFDPWLSWHKITGEKISGPAPLEFQPPNGSSDEGHEDRPKRIYRHSRPKFHEMLSRQAEKVGIHVQYGKRAVEYYEDPDAGKAGTILENGETIEADVVLAADGIGSTSTKVTMGREVPARPTGFAIYRAAFPIQLAMVDPMVRDRFQLMEDGHSVVELWMGDGLHALFGRSQDEMAWTLTHGDLEQAVESWSTTVDPEVVLRTTANIPGWPEVADRVIKLTPKDRLLDFKLVWREPQPCWTSPAGRIVQLGDAAHTLLPSSGSGATQGIEDAISLATCLRLAGKVNAHWATRVHNKLRFERVACLQRLGVVSQESRHHPNPTKEPDVTRKLLGSWIWRHDPELYAVERYEEALAHLVDGDPFQNTNIPPGYTYQPWTIDELLAIKAAGEEIPLEGDWD